MASVAGATATRSVLRSCSTRRAAFRLGSEAKSTHSPFHMASNKPLSRSMLRCRVESSFCVESMLPYHMATASALMTSMLSVSRRSYGWLSEGVIHYGVN
ncbi:PREDICTED: protein NUCLEAR FUSION DEFECTIVE 6, chloroplastic/mitochondrial-like isoform X1 [Lupinus angustifolius]|uniref:protein NUCLEAR FUSION DEFECTIVE 6, chloroplastic/mitochondrial-like isoform X1 n=1 Tax=Lupinus angustifolius TaxID=3871 RepID=UPI00092E6C5E|nr:PREDICTED: protein NUCLEAR FUSION DEFECTIVE 6, chloroplastic/mitochondrial-like isoform X1 [Lupinus angustifolius]